MNTLSLYIHLLFKMFHLFYFYRNSGGHFCQLLTPTTFVEYPPKGLIDEKNRTVNVGKCQIVVLFGHGRTKKTWSWNINACGSGTSIMCYSERNSKGIEDYQDLWPKEIEKTDEVVEWSSILLPSPNNEYLTKMGQKLFASKIFDLVYDQTEQKAKGLCEDVCCSQIRVRFIWSKNNRLIYNPKNEQTDYDGEKTIQDYVYHCKSKKKVNVPR